MADSQTSIERPKPTAEQKRAANVAYKQLLAKTIEIGEPIMQYPAETRNGEPYVSIIYGHTKKPIALSGSDFTPNARQADVLVPQNGDSEVAWMTTHDEEQMHKTGVLGSFSVVASERGAVQESYVFYPDGNIERSRWTMAGVNGADDGDKIEHLGWLDPRQTEALTITIENSQPDPQQ